MLKAFPDQNKARSLESHTAVLSLSRKREFRSCKAELDGRAWLARHDDPRANPRAPIKVDDIVVRHADAA
jgi:hypothetical protein